MAHYYFDLKNGTTQRDHAGRELRSDAEAIAQAYVIADEVSTRLATHEDHERHICVIHEDGHEVTRIPVDIAASKASAPRFKKLS
ncbi:DUF6894 family protein [Tardiphaga sp. 215_C5_N2_1]|jgi:hypothetical protein|uniref:DUF6894 family protein n=1 Tax=Tardiphaga TaxID=1395974 RepID=UPI000E754BB8|nr:MULTISPECIES: hypothetical protein [Tardiphaga]MDR6661902.1 hypothetical protein [Tardiphaga robiniae]NUU40925.1 hypothetical protein [Tardiphaga robiniae]UFS74207.1 hypothetical protein LPB73_20125 [Tardiphaga sp. 37S4]